jgi:hypothetical protein
MYNSSHSSLWWSRCMISKCQPTPAPRTQSRATSKMLILSHNVRRIYHLKLPEHHVVLNAGYDDE